MTRTQIGVNMVPGAERQGMLSQNEKNNTAKTNQSKTKSGKHIIKDITGAPRANKIAPSRRKTTPRRCRHPVWRSQT